MKETVIIVGGGDSVREEWKNGLFDKIKDKGAEIWSLNFAFKLMPYLPDREFFVDRSFFDKNKDDLEQLARQNVPITARYHSKFAYIKEIQTFNVTKEPHEAEPYEALKKDKLFIGHMGLSGLFSLSYGIAAGYKTIFLLGYDFGTNSIKNLNTHWYQEKISDLKIQSAGAGRPNIYRQTNTDTVKNFVHDFQYYKKAINTKIYNVSLNSNIYTFPKISYEDFYKMLSGEKNEQ